VSTTTHVDVLGNSRAPSRRFAVPAHVLRLAELILRQVVGACLVRNAVAEDPGIGGSGISALAAFRAVSLTRLRGNNSVLIG